MDDTLLLTDLLRSITEDLKTNNLELKNYLQDYEIKIKRTIKLLEIIKNQKVYLNAKMEEMSKGLIKSGFCYSAMTELPRRLFYVLDGFDRAGLNNFYISISDYIVKRIYPNAVYADGLFGKLYTIPGQLRTLSFEKSVYPSDLAKIIYDLENIIDNSILSKNFPEVARVLNMLKVAN